MLSLCHNVRVVEDDYGGLLVKYDIKKRGVSLYMAEVRVKRSAATNYTTES